MKPFDGAAGAAQAKLGVLLIGMGGPDRLEDVEPYLARVRGGRPFSRELLEELKQRYALIGGGSPLLAASREQGRALEALLRSQGQDCQVEVGMRFWTPYVKEAAAKLLGAGCARLLGVCLTPQESGFSVGGYRSAMVDALKELGSTLPFDFVSSWHLRPGFIEALAENAREALGRFPEGAKVQVLFSAHSLPLRFIGPGDPYPTQLQETADAVGRLLGRPYRLVYQSQTPGKEEWLGPETGSAIAEAKAAGFDGVLVSPVGFICDHLEVLYDVDVLFAGQARELGLRFERSRSLGAHPGLIRSWAELAAAVRA